MLSTQYSTHCRLPKRCCHLSVCLPSSFLMKFISSELGWTHALVTLMGPVYKSNTKSISHFQTKSLTRSFYFGLFYTSQTIVDPHYIVSDESHLRIQCTFKKEKLAWKFWFWSLSHIPPKYLSFYDPCYCSQGHQGLLKELCKVCKFTSWLGTRSASAKHDSKAKPWDIEGLKQTVTMPQKADIFYDTKKNL